MTLAWNGAQALAQPGQRRLGRLAEQIQRGERTRAQAAAARPFNGAHLLHKRMTAKMLDGLHVLISDLLHRQDVTGADRNLVQPHGAVKAACHPRRLRQPSLRAQIAEEVMQSLLDGNRTGQCVVIQDHCQLDLVHSIPKRHSLKPLSPVAWTCPGEERCQPGDYIIQFSLRPTLLTL